MTPPASTATARRLITGFVSNLTFPDADFATLVVPNVQSGRDLRSRIGGTYRTLTLSQLARRILTGQGWRVLPLGEQDRFYQRLFQHTHLEYLAPLAQRPGTRRVVAALMLELLRANLTPQELSRATLTARERDIAALFGAYLEQCAADQTFELAAAEYFAARAEFQPLTALVHGFAYFDTAQEALLNAVLGQGSVVTLPWHPQGRAQSRIALSVQGLEAYGFTHQPHGGQPSTVGERLTAGYVTGQPFGEFIQASFPSVEEEVRACLKQVIRWLDEGVPAERIAVVTRNEEVYLSALADLSQEYQVPLVSGRTLPLLHTALGGLIQAWLDAHQGDWSYSLTRRLLTHPLLPGSAEWLVKARQLSPQFPAGLKDWGELEWLAVPETTSPHEVLGILRRLLTELGVMDCCAENPTLNTAMTLLKRRLESDAHRRETGPREQVLGSVAHALRTVGVPVLLGRSGVRVADPLAMLGRSFDRVWILGLSHGQFPARTSDHPLIDAQVRERWAEHGVRLPNAALLSAAQEAQFLQALTAGRGEVVVSRPRRGPDGRPLLEGAYWQRLGTGRPLAPLPSGSEAERWLEVVLAGGAVPPELQPVLDAEQAREAGRLHPYHGLLQNGIDVSQRRWSPSQLHDAGACRFRWFATRMLGLPEPLDPDAAEDRRALGTLLHAALEGALAGEPGGAPADLASRLARAELAFGQAEQKVIKEGQLRPGPLWPVEREELRRTVQRAVAAPEFMPSGHTAFELEKEHQVTVQAGNYSYSLKGVIDRTDQTPHGLMITDYKTGSYVSRVVKGGQLNLEIQLPLYMQGTGAAGGRYYSIKKAELVRANKGAGPWRESPRSSYRWAEHQQDVQDFLIRLGDHLGAGDVRPSPDDAREACTYCYLQAVCRIRPNGGPA